MHFDGLTDATLVVFLLVYVAMGFGTLPGFKLDRTGAAIVGALAMLSIGAISPQASWDAIDYRTIGMLFGLMVVSSAFAVAGFYDWTVHKVAALPVSPPVLLAVLIAVGGGLSALLTNDVIVVAMTPLLVSLTLARGLNPVPFLLAFCFAANAGSAGTLIGSPQNMIAAQGLGLSFNGFLKVAGLPALLSLPLIWGILAFMYRNRWAAPKSADAPPPEEVLQPLDKIETAKAGIIATVVIVAFIFSSWPRELIALAGAGTLLISRRTSSKDMLRHVDGNLLLLIMGLFVVNQAFSNTGLPQEILAGLDKSGIDLNHPLSLFCVGGVLSNIVGNNPTVMLLTPYLHPGAGADALGAALALSTGFSSNMIIFGSLAGIIVVEQAAACGIKIGFGEFAKAGLPVSLASLAMAAGWILLMAH
ncbi:SLC13 family permease [Ruficoccus sp. ZRK36]|uniref:SLC13 family permease n=1 Tax=Ruficoccus sp. ZRK36 TaxID=2866311 RepID=UPI001C72FDA5|nr:SLC13 family permease [Ruficoccus sp. ZRK36]QYY34480.1 hypothetical protein K0V07_09175 [Ruficoccus sp. ZRK36]